MATSIKLLIVAGARPNFMKVAPLIHAIHRHNAAVGSLPPLRLEQGEDRDEVSNSSAATPCSVLRPLTYALVHTGQHYDAAMSDVFFGELGIPAPDINLQVGSASHAVQTAAVMTRFEPVVLEIKPDWVIVVGDVNSTLACALVASKLGVRVAHIEAGLRSFDRSMPEEINRIVADALSDLLLTPSSDANENLRREGIPDEKIKLVGNVMIDALVANLAQARALPILQQLGLRSKAFLYVTLHRPGNVDNRETLGTILKHLKEFARQFPVIFPMHPRTRKMASEFGFSLNGVAGFQVLEPIGYHESLSLSENARVVLTDSGGVQEETTFFRTPCLTLRPNTERPITVSLGSNRLTSLARLDGDFKQVLQEKEQIGKIPPLWDGKAAERMVHSLLVLWLLVSGLWIAKLISGL